MMELVSKICETQDGRSKMLIVNPELFVDVFLNLDKAKVIGLPSDVQVQSMVYDPHYRLIFMRLWSSEFDVVDAHDEEILLLRDGFCDSPEANPWRYFGRCGDKIIRRVRNGEGYAFTSDGIADFSPEPLGWYLQFPEGYYELTEAVAAAILGGRPWENPADV